MDLRHRKHFNSTFPVACAGMNSVSNVKLALAIKHAGGYPSFVAFNHIAVDKQTPKNENGLPKFVFDPDTLDQHLNAYYSAGGDRHYILSVSTALLMTSSITVSLILKHKPAYIELLDDDLFNSVIFLAVLKIIQANGTKILLKALTSGAYFAVRTALDDSPYNNINGKIIDGVVIKGAKAAGRVSNNDVNLITEVKNLRHVDPELIIIAQGGVYCSEDIVNLQQAGADIVSVGTLFSLTHESSMPMETKLMMLEKSFADTKKIGLANQNGIVFSEIGSDVENNTDGLRLGMHTRSKGHVFAGAGLDHVKEIKSVKQVMDELTQGL